MTAIDPQTLTSLITRLEEEYGKATMEGNKVLSWDVVAATNIIIESVPTLLSALKHYMAVAEAGERLAEAVKESGRETYEHFEGSHWVEYDTDEIDEALASYSKNTKN